MNNQEKQEVINDLIERICQEMAKEGKVNIDLMLTDEDRYHIIRRAFKNRTDDTLSEKFESIFSAEVRALARKIGAQMMMEEKDRFEKLAENAIRSSMDDVARNTVYHVMQKAKITGTLNLVLEPSQSK